MADNVAITPGAGATVAADDVGGVLYQRTKLCWGVDGVGSDVNASTPLPVAQTGTATVSVTPPTTLATNVKTVTTAGTRVQLTTAACVSITVRAHTGNAGTIYLGGSTVAAASGYRLDPGESVSLDLSNASQVWLDAAASGDGVSYLTVS